MKYSIDLKNVKSRDDLHTLLKASLPLPDYYGNNLDALYDVLTDLTEEVEIEISGIEEVPEELNGYMDSFLRVLEDAAGKTNIITVDIVNEKTAAGGENLYGILMAAGKGSRFNDGDKPKQFLMLGDKPIIIRSLLGMLEYHGLRKIILPVPEGFVAHTEELVEKYIHTDADIRVITGKEERTETLYSALEYIDETFGVKEDTIVITHDGVRPFLTGDMVEGVVENTELYGAATIGIAAVDTLVASVDGREIGDMLDRNYIHHIQTPQGFYAKRYMEIWEELSGEQRAGITDASGVLMARGDRVALVRGSKYNIKITYPEDLAIAEALINKEDNGYV